MAIWWLDVFNFNICATILLLFQQDVINLAYENIFSNIAIINFGSGWTFFKFHHIAKPFSLGVIRWQRHWLLPKFCRMHSSAVQIFSDSDKVRTVICGRQRLKGVDSKSRAAMPRKARFLSQRRSRLLAKFGDSCYIFPGFFTNSSGTLPTDNRALLAV